jgi:hypothetical protein
MKEDMNIRPLLKWIMKKLRPCGIGFYAIEEMVETSKNRIAGPTKEMPMPSRLFGDEDATLIKLLKVRNGRMTGVEEYFVEEPIIQLI